MVYQYDTENRIPVLFNDQSVNKSINQSIMPKEINKDLQIPTTRNQNSYRIPLVRHEFANQSIDDRIPKMNERMENLIKGNIYTRSFFYF